MNPSWIETRLVYGGSRGAGAVFTQAGRFSGQCNCWCQPGRAMLHINRIRFVAFRFVVDVIAAQGFRSMHGRGSLRGACLEAQH